MSLRVDLEKALENLRVTRQNIEADINRLEDLIKDHFELATNKVIPPKAMRELEKAIYPGDGKP